MKITTIGLDLAKSVFQVHGVDERGKVGLRKQLKRAQVPSFFANLSPCLIGMEACASAHYWARKLQQFGHTAKLMPEQQAILAVHRARQALVKARTAQANQIRGLLAEFGVVLPQGLAQLGQRLPVMLEDGENELPGSFRQLLARLGENLAHLQRQGEELEREIQRWHGDSEASRRLAAIPGIGVLGASALVATVGNAHSFAHGRQLAAWLGMVPKQASSGGKTTLLGMSKRGDSYLRTLLIHGARSVLRQVECHPERADPWLRQLLARRPKNVVAVALANKNARIAWALLAHGRDYQPQYRAADA